MSYYRGGVSETKINIQIRYRRYNLFPRKKITRFQTDSEFFRLRKTEIFIRRVRPRHLLLTGLTIITGLAPLFCGEILDNHATFGVTRMEREEYANFESKSIYRKRDVISVRAKTVRKLLSRTVLLKNNNIGTS